MLNHNEPNDILESAIAAEVSSDDPGQVSFPGAIETTLDVDLYEVSLAAGDWLQLRTASDDYWWYTPIWYPEDGENRSISPIDYQDVAVELRIFDGEGNEVATTANGEGISSYNLDWVAETTGVYYIGVSGAENVTYDVTIADSGTAGETGDYYLQLNVTPPPDAETSPNDTIASASEIDFNQGYYWDRNYFWLENTLGDNPNIDPKLDVDFYRLKAEAREWVNLHANATTISIFDAEGNQLYSGDNQGGFLAATDQEYYIAISSPGNNNYDPNVEGSGSNGTLIGDYYLSGWKEESREAKTGKNDTIASAIALINAEERYYYDYEDDDQQDYFYTNGIIGDNADIQSVLDVDFYSFEATAGQWANINTWDTTLRVFNGDGNEITIGEDQTGFLVPEDGTYYIGVSAVGNDNYDPNVEGSGDSGNSVGNYYLDVILQAGLEATDTTNDTLESAIAALNNNEWGYRHRYYSNQGIIGDNPNFAAGLDVDFYEFEVESDQWVELYAWQTQLIVFDEDGNQLWSGENNLNFLALEDEEYYIGVSAVGNDNYDPNTEGSGTSGTSLGNYYLSFSTQEAQETTGETNDTIATSETIYDDQEWYWYESYDGAIIGDNPNIVPELDVDFYQLEVELGEWVDISAWETTLRVFDEAGNEQFSGNSRLEFIADETTTYYLGVSSFGNNSYDPNVAGSGNSGETLGTYYLDVWGEMTPEGGGDTDDTISTAKTLEPNHYYWEDEVRDYQYFSQQGYFGDNLAIDLTLDVDFYELEIEAGDWVNISAWNGTLRLFDDSGNEVKSAENHLDFVAEDNGIYYLGVSSLGNESYDPNVEGSGNSGSSSGQYYLSISTENTIEGTGITDDAIAAATPVTFNNYSSFSEQGFIGDNLTLSDPELDVDFYSLEITAGEWANLNAWGYQLRLFDAEGNEIASEENSLEFFAASTNNYYLGISSIGNNNYNPETPESGEAGEKTGRYYLNIDLETTPEGTAENIDDILNNAISINSQADDPRYFETSGFVGDNPNIASGLDVDFYEIALDAGDHLTVNLPWYYWPCIYCDVPATDELDMGLLEGENLANYPPDQTQHFSDHFAGEIPVYGDSDPRIVDRNPHLPEPTFDADVLGGDIAVEPNSSDLIYPWPREDHSFILRLFDADGNEIEVNENSIDFEVETSGTYYVGVSGQGNNSYNPNAVGSGSEGEIGQYHLYFNIDSDPKPETPVNDTFEGAIILSSLAENRYSSFRGYIGNNPNLEADQVGLDVDFYKIELAAETELNVHSWSQTLRLFNAAGEALISEMGYFSYFSSEAGTYYVGVSAAENNNYNPEITASGTTGETGEYQISFNTWFDAESNHHQEDYPAIVWIEAIDAVKPEGDSGSTPFTFEIMREGDLDSEIILEWSLNWIEPAWNTIDENDFVDGVIPAGEVIFEPGETSKEITIEIAGDTIAESGAEGWEQFTFSLQPVSENVEVEVESAIGKILDDDEEISAIEEANDTLNTAVELSFNDFGEAQVFSTIGDNFELSSSLLDVDLFQFQLEEGDNAIISNASFSVEDIPQLLNAILRNGSYQPTETDILMRVFDGEGNEVASELDTTLELIAPQTGNYYLGVSAAENFSYTPLEMNSGEVAQEEANNPIDYSIKISLAEEEASDRNLRFPPLRLAAAIPDDAEEIEPTPVLTLAERFHFTGAHNDVIDAAVGNNNSRFYSGSGDDQITVNNHDSSFFGGAGNDRFQASSSQGDNRIYGGLGDDDFLLGSSDRAFGGAGDDDFFVSGEGGDNLIFGGTGADVYWFDSENLPETANTIADFVSGEDAIALLDAEINFTDLTFSQQAEDTAIFWNDQPVAILANMKASSLSEADFLPIS